MDISNYPCPFANLNCYDTFATKAEAIKHVERCHPAELQQENDALISELEKSSDYLWQYAHISKVGRKELCIPYSDIKVSELRYFKELICDADAQEVRVRV